MKRILFILLIIGIIISALVIPVSANNSATIKLGDYVEMGTYYGKPILWRCVSFEKISGYDSNGNPIIDSTDTRTSYADGYLPLMLADRIITIKAFDARGGSKGSHGRGYVENYVRGYYRQQGGSNYWGDSCIREWLNSATDKVAWSYYNYPTESSVSYNPYSTEAGFLTNFTDNELNAIQTVTQKSLLDAGEYAKSNENRKKYYHKYNCYISEVVQNYSSAYSENITDTMFLLDVKQVNTVYNNSSTLGTNYYIGKTTLEAVSASNYKVSNGNWFYWLRSPMGSSYGSDVRYVNSNGRIGRNTASQSFESNDMGFGACRGDIGVRPAFFLNLTLFNPNNGEGSFDRPYTTKLLCTFHNYDGTVIKQTKCEFGQDIISPSNPTRRGYEFLGWQGYTQGMIISENVSFTAQYEANEYEITINGGISHNVTFDKSYVLPIDEDKSDGFLGYYTQPFGKGTRLTDEFGNSIEGYGFDYDITVYPLYSGFLWSKDISTEYGKSSTGTLEFASPKDVIACVITLKYNTGLNVNIINSGSFEHVYAEEPSINGDFSTISVICQYSDTALAEANKLWELFEVEVSPSTQGLIGDFEISIDSFTLYDENSNEIIIEDSNVLNVNIHSIYASEIQIIGTSECIGTENYSANVYPNNAFDKSVIWSVDDKNIATIDENGELTAIGDGTVVITATANDDSGITATKTVTVHNLKVKSIIVSGSSIASGMAIYQATILPDYAENKSVIWSVSDDEMAKIDENGVLTPLKIGTVTVIATATDGSEVVGSKEITLEPYNTINSLESNIGAWDKEFEPFTFDYTIYLPKENGQIKFTSNFTNGSAKLNGDSIFINKVAKSVALSEGINSITIVRAGVDGTIDSTYYITIVVGDVVINNATLNDNNLRFDLLSCIDKNAKLYVATYDKNGMMINLDVENVLLKTATNSEKTFEVLNNVNNDTVNIFVFDENQQPLCMCTRLKTN